MHALKFVCVCVIFLFPVWDAFVLCVPLSKHAYDMYVGLYSCLKAIFLIVRPSTPRINARIPALGIQRSFASTLNKFATLAFIQTQTHTHTHTHTHTQIGKIASCDAACCLPSLECRHFPGAYPKCKDGV